MRRAVVFACSITMALVTLALPVSAGSLAEDNQGLACNSDTDSPTVDSANGEFKEFHGRKCPNCDCVMRPCLPSTGYKWMCHTCGLVILR